MTAATKPAPPQFSPEELASAEAQAANLRAMLRGMSNNEAPARAPAPPVRLDAPATTPKPQRGIASSPMTQTAAHLVVDADAFLADQREQERRQAIAAESARQARLAALPSYRIANALLPMLATSWLHERTLHPDAKQPRNNDDRAIEGHILCNLIGLLCLNGTPEDQAADAITQIMHYLRKNGKTVEECSEIVELAANNFGIEVEEEELAKVNQIVSRNAPAWAWSVIDALMKETKAGQGMSFTPNGRAAVSNAHIALRTATKDTTLKELTVDDLAEDPDFAEVEHAAEGDDNTEG